MFDVIRKSIPQLVFSYSAGGYLLTQKDVFFDRARACQIVASLMSDRGKLYQIDLPRPAIVKVMKS